MAFTLSGIYFVTLATAIGVRAKQFKTDSCYGLCKDGYFCDDVTAICEPCKTICKAELMKYYPDCSYRCQKISTTLSTISAGSWTTLKTDNSHKSHWSVRIFAGSFVVLALGILFALIASYCFGKMRGMKKTAPPSNEDHACADSMLPPSYDEATSQSAGQQQSGSK